MDRTEILERCTKKFRSYEQYKSDERYLRICLKYADCCSDPLDVFKFLEEWEIGVTKWASCNQTSMTQPTCGTVRPSTTACGHTIS